MRRFLLRVFFCIGDCACRTLSYTRGILPTSFSAARPSPFALRITVPTLCQHIFVRRALRLPAPYLAVEALFVNNFFTRYILLLFYFFKTQKRKLKLSKKPIKTKTDRKRKALLTSVRSVFSDYSFIRSLMISPAMMSPTTDGTKETLPGVLSPLGLMGGSSENTTFRWLMPLLRNSVRITLARGSV